MEAVFTREDNRDPSCGSRTEESRLEVIRIRPAEMHPGAADASTPEPGEVASAVSSALRTTKRDGVRRTARLLNDCCAAKISFALGETLANGDRIWRLYRPPSGVYAPAGRRKFYGRPIRSRVEPRVKRLCSEKLQGRFFVSARRFSLEIYWQIQPHDWIFPIDQAR